MNPLSLLLGVDQSTFFVTAIRHQLLRGLTDLHIDGTLAAEGRQIIQRWHWNPVATD